MIIRKYGVEFEREENAGENQNGNCSVFAHALVGRSNPFQAESFSVIWSADKACITLSNSGDLAKDSEEQETTAYFCDHF